MQVINRVVPAVEYGGTERFDQRPAWHDQAEPKYPSLDEA